MADSQLFFSMAFFFENEPLARAWDLHDECQGILEDSVPYLKEAPEGLKKRAERALSRPIIRICYVRDKVTGHLNWKNKSERDLALNLSIHNAIVELRKISEREKIKADIRLDSNIENWNRGGRFESQFWICRGFLAYSTGLKGLIDDLQLLEISNRIDVDLRRYQKRLRSVKGNNLGYLGNFFL